jgi:hypothetical protein
MRDARSERALPRRCPARTHSRCHRRGSRSRGPRAPLSTEQQGLTWKRKSNRVSLTNALQHAIDGANRGGKRRNVHVACTTTTQHQRVHTARANRELKLDLMVPAKCRLLLTVSDEAHRERNLRLRDEAARTGPALLGVAWQDGKRQSGNEWQRWPCW